MKKRKISFVARIEEADDARERAHLLRRRGAALAEPLLQGDERRGLELLVLEDREHARVARERVLLRRRRLERGRQPRPQRREHEEAEQEREQERVAGHHAHRRQDGRAHRDEREHHADETEPTGHRLRAAALLAGPHHERARVGLRRLVEQAARDRELFAQRRCATPGPSRRLPRAEPTRRSRRGLLRRRASARAPLRRSASTSHRGAGRATTCRTRRGRRRTDGSPPPQRSPVEGNAFHLPSMRASARS